MISDRRDVYSADTVHLTAYEAYILQREMKERKKKKRKKTKVGKTRSAIDDAEGKDGKRVAEDELEDER